MSIQLIIGPMFAGKTTELLRRLKRAEIAQKRVLAVKFSGDVRYSMKPLITTHEGNYFDAIAVDKLEDVRLVDHEVVGIDEGQFFPDLFQHAVEWSQQGIAVIISALSGTFTQHPWPNVSTLIPLCDNVDLLLAVCSFCGADAMFSKRTQQDCDGEEDIGETNDVFKPTFIGGTESYKACCRKCLSK